MCALLFTYILLYAGYGISHVILAKLVNSKDRV